jgi:hypothetical protein
MRLLHKVFIVLLIILSSVSVLVSLYLSVFGITHCFLDKCYALEITKYIKIYYVGALYYLILLICTIKIYTTKKVIYLKTCIIMSMIGSFLSFGYGLCMPCVINMATSILYFVISNEFMRSLHVRRA